MAEVSEGRKIVVQGRLVWGGNNLFKGQPKTSMETKAPIMDTKTGLQVIEYAFGLAIPKAESAAFWQAIHEEAYTMFPSRQIPPSFAMKYDDGDGIDNKGQPFSAREGYKGCLVVRCTTRIKPPVFKFENGANVLINEGIKNGDWVQVSLSIKAHPAMSALAKAGLYMNPEAIRLVAYDTEIVSSAAPSADDLFGTSAPIAPPGTSQFPVAPAGGFGPPMVPQAPVAPPPAPLPNYAVLPPAHQPQAPQAMPQAPGVPQYPQQPMAPSAPVAPAMPAGMPAMPGQAQPAPYAQPGYPPAPGAPAPMGQPVYPSNPGVPGMPMMPQSGQGFPQQ